MDIRPQSHEIIRTWAFYTIVKAYLHEKTVPWHNIVISGWILDPDRKNVEDRGNVIAQPSIGAVFQRCRALLGRSRPARSRYCVCRSRLRQLETLGDQALQRR
jgi:hypothetical protein